MAKKSQMHSMESISVLIVFFIIIVLGLVFYFRVQRSVVENQIDALNDNMKNEIAQEVFSLPELDCSTLDVVYSNCLDLFKLQAAVAVINQNKQHYFGRFKYSVINVTQVFPVSDVVYTVYNMPKGDSKSTLNFPVLIYDPATRLRNFGLLTIEVYK